MTTQDWISTRDIAARFGGASRFVSTIPADQGVRNALQSAFACTKDMPEDFDRLLAQLR